MEKILIGCIVLASLAGPCFGSQGGNDEPKPQVTVKRHRVGVIFTVNGDKYPNAIVVTVEKDELLVSKRDLIGLGVKEESLPFDLADVELRSLDPKFLFDRYKGMVSVNFPPEILSEVSIGRKRGIQSVLTESQYGAWLNYDLRLQNNNDQTYTQAYVDGSVSTKWGVLKSQHIYNSGGTEQPSIKRLATYFRHDDEDDKTTTILGDTYSLASPWGVPVSFGGIRIARNFGLYPQGYLINPNYTIKGVATVPSVVEIWEGGQKTYSERVPAKPFSITDYVPFSSGVAQVIVRDQFNNVTVQPISLYTASDVLGHGIDSYSLELGMLKRDGVYGEGFFAAGYKRGFDLNRVVSGIPLLGRAEGYLPVTDVEGRIEGTKDDQKFGAGVSLLSWFGNVKLNGAIAAKAPTNVSPSISYINGNQGEDAYKDYSKRPTNINVSWNRSFSGSYGNGSIFASLSKPTNWVPTGSTYLANPMTMIGVNYSPSDSWGFSYVRSVSGEASDRNTTQAFSISKKIDVVRTQLSLTRGENYSNLMLSINIPFGTTGNISSMASKDSQSVSYSDSTMDRSATWGVSVGKSQNMSRLDADSSYDFSKGRLYGAVSKVGEMSGYRAGLSGSVLFADSSLWLGRQINESVLVVKSEQPDLPIKLNNIPVGNTGKSGSLVLSNLQSWRNNTITVNGEVLPAGYSMNSDSRKDVTQGYGAVSTVSMSVTKPGWFAVFVVDGTQLLRGSKLMINGKQFYATSKGVEAKGMDFGQAEVKIGSCVKTVDIPVEAEKHSAKVKINIECGG